MHVAYDAQTWGSAAQWVAGAGTFLAFLGFFRLIRQDRRERLKGHASRLAIWLEADREAATVHLQMRNVSDDPFLFIIVFMDRQDERSRSWPVGDLGPQQHARVQLEGFLDKPARCRVAFTDTYGRRWHRFVGGQLLPAYKLRRRVVVLKRGEQSLLDVHPLTEEHLFRAEPEAEGPGC